MADPLPTTVAAAMRAAQQCGLARLEAQLLLAHVLQRSRTWLVAHDDQPLATSEAAEWSRLVAQRLDQVPLAYLTGQHEFYGLPLQITPAVLDPRPDTETLVEWALTCLAPLVTDGSRAAPRVADLGTGSGAIALAIAHACAAAHVTGVDISPDALAVARRNGERLQLPVQWALGRWYEPLAGQRFDLLVSNPPYLAEDDVHLTALRHEPRQALCAADNGLEDLRFLCQNAPRHLTPGGWLLMEHGHVQGDAVAAMLRAQGFVEIAHRRDLAGHVRCTGGRWPSDLREQP